MGKVISSIEKARLEVMAEKMKSSIPVGTPAIAKEHRETLFEKQAKDRDAWMDEIEEKRKNSRRDMLLKQKERIEAELAKLEE